MSTNATNVTNVTMETLAQHDQARTREYEHESTSSTQLLAIHMQAISSELLHLLEELSPTCK